MRWRKVTRAIAGTILILLGLLWILQGADVIRIRPILCVADCQPVIGGSLTWLIIGVAALIVGAATIGLRRLRR